MNISQSLVDRFFENKCSSEEKEAVVNFFKSNPEAIKLFIKKEEWDAIEITGTLSESLSEEMLYNIKSTLFSTDDKEKQFSLRSISVKWVAAAAVLLFVGILMYNKVNHSNGNAAIAIHKPSDTAAKFDIGKGNWKIKFNNGDKPIELALQDGSSVTLSAHSSIRYQDSFTDNKRNIFLEGEAFFQVTKDKSKPFTVFAGNLSTTALGTSFIVSAIKQKRYDIQVKLFTGKVVIRSTKKLAGWNKDVYLIPGQQLCYQELKANVDVSRFVSSKEKNISTNTAATTVNEELTFSNAALVEVLDKLSELKGVTIKYSKDQLAGINFTGNINKNDNIEVVLKAIAQMNGLEIMQSDNSFVVTKTSK